MDHHPYASIFPMMDGAELQALADDIKANGLEHPILIDSQRRILDGRNRYAACQLAGIDAEFDTFTGSEQAALSKAISLNLIRRHLSESQRGMVAAKLATMKHGGNRRDQVAHVQLEKHEEVKLPDAARLLNVGVRTVSSCRKVQNDGIPALVKAVESGEIKAKPAEQIASLPKAQQPAAIERHVARSPVVDAPMSVSPAPVQSGADRLRERAHANQRPIALAMDAINILRSIYPDHPLRENALRIVVNFVLDNHPHLKGIR